MAPRASNPTTTFGAFELPRLARHFESASGEILGAILDQSADCIKVIGPTGQIDFMNRNGRCAMEIDDFAAIAGRDWWELWPEESQPLVRDAVERARAGESHRFEAFCPTAKGTPRWWDVAVSPLRDGEGVLQGIVSISRDVTDRVNARELRETAAHEMRHRLQNAYTLTAAIINAMARGSDVREQFAREMNERLERLGIVQSLLLDDAGVGTTSLEKLVRKLTEPFCAEACTMRFTAFPDLLLDEHQARAITLAIGELSTNSNKYGALGAGGSIDLSAALNEGVLRIVWSERSSRPLPVPSPGGGNGFKLIRRALTASRGSLEVDWRDDGVDVVILLPVA